MKRIISIGIYIPTEEFGDDFVRFDTQTSLSDYDIAIFRPSLEQTNYESDYITSSYEGKTLYGKKSSIQIIENTAHWNEEIRRMLSNGKNIFVILSPKEDFYVHTGTKEFTGTGRNQRTINHVEPFNNYAFLPNNSYDIYNSKGNTVVPIHPLVKDYYETLKEHIDYECYLKTIESNPTVLFTTKNKDKILGLIEKIDKGAIIFLPDIYFGYEEYEEFESEEDEENANKLGLIFFNHILKIDKIISNDDSRTPPPSWADEKKYQLKEAEITKQKIEINVSKISEIQKEIEVLNDSLSEQENIKGLLYETGKPLENAVIQALKILGYKAESYDDGTLELDQVIDSPEGHRYIGECEGKDNRDIDVSKFRQLQDSLNEDFQRDEVAEKAFGILFGNPQRLLNPNDRTLDFTKKCKSGAAREKIALVKTSDLFEIVKYLLENDDEKFKKKCREEIHKQLGEIVKFPAIPKKRFAPVIKK